MKICTMGLLFLYALALALICMHSWDTMLTVSVLRPALPAGFHQLPARGMSETLALNSSLIIYLLLVLSNALLAIALIMPRLQEQGRRILLAIVAGLALLYCTVKILPLFIQGLSHPFIQVQIMLFQLIDLAIVLGNVALLVLTLKTAFTQERRGLAWLVLATELFFFLLPTVAAGYLFALYMPEQQAFSLLRWDVYVPFAALANVVIFVASRPLDPARTRIFLLLAVLIAGTLVLFVGSSLFWDVQQLGQGLLKDRWITLVVLDALLSLVALVIALLALWYTWRTRLQGQLAQAAAASA
ncbi:hypothetical protein EPA93_34780 [Ktedonosporobacter rubrisoli]|uniref:Uncharacterized protein n=1 Tax=Ktedonosporobacter rubrisoli TaxID=2509675 RepID=A0A4P6JYH2_KTERU|nr:hypothetical protein [Ktedonosporobacter rubrisoli]QBD80858.1 hypothetical protein EPA93_34780 [Ktedonosporobacter rubrisoli]